MKEVISTLSTELRDEERMKDWTNLKWVKWEKLKSHHFILFSIYFFRSFRKREQQFNFEIKLLKSLQKFELSIKIRKSLSHSSSLFSFVANSEETLRWNYYIIKVIQLFTTDNVNLKNFLLTITETIISTFYSFLSNNVLIRSFDV